MRPALLVIAMTKPCWSSRNSHSRNFQHDYYVACSSTRQVAGVNAAAKLNADDLNRTGRTVRCRFKPEADRGLLIVACGGVAGTLAQPT